ncbi:MAG: cystathionine gamma-synthase [Gammaproteobacteria bacterium]
MIPTSKDNPPPSPVTEPRARHSTTAAVRTGIESDTQFGAVVPPVYLSSNFSFAGFGEKRTYDYTRSGNPTRDTLARALTEIEGGADAVVTASGMAAVTLALQLLAPDDTLVVPHDCYGGSYRLFTALAQKGQFKLRVVNQTDRAALQTAFADKPKLVWVETPSNPLLRIVDIRRLADLTHAGGGLLLVDNTFLSPLGQQPFAHGADIVLYSTTKYLNGHSDVVGGAVISRDRAVHDQLAWWANCLGLAGAPFDSYLTLRGLRSLPARLRVHLENAAAVVELLAQHAAVQRVYYPGLKTHPGHALAARQQSNFGAMVSFELCGGEAEIRAFLHGLRCISLAESLGGVESLIAHPVSMTHASMDEAARIEAGISAQLLRFSVGIEAAEDLLADLKAGLDRALPTSVRVARRAAS